MDNNLFIGLILLSIIISLLNFIQTMSNQSRLDAANEKTAAAIAGIGKDFQAFVQEVREAQGGNVSEEALAKAEANANALAALDAEKEETEDAGDQSETDVEDAE